MDQLINEAVTRGFRTEQRSWRRDHGALGAQQVHVSLLGDRVRPIRPSPTIEDVISWVIRVWTLILDRTVKESWRRVRLLPSFWPSQYGLLDENEVIPILVSVAALRA